MANGKRNLGIIAAVSAVIFLGTVGTASAAGQITSEDIKNQDVQSVDLAPNSVGESELAFNAVDSDAVQYNSLHGWDVENGTLTGVDVQDGSLKPADFSAEAKAELKGDTGADGVKGDTGDTGPEGPKGDPGVNQAYAATTAEVNVANIGGSFKTNATLAGTLDLPAGTYKLTADGFFKSNQVTSGNATLQVALRAGWNGVDTFGTDYGTGFTGGSPAAANREVTTSTTRVVTLSEPTTVQILVFGYDGAGQGSADSGKFDATVFVTAEVVELLN